MGLERSELSIEQLREIVGPSYHLLRAHQKASLKNLGSDGSIKETSLEVNSFVPRDYFQGTMILVSERRQEELLKLCGNTAIYDDTIEDTIDQDEVVNAALEVKRRFSKNQQAAEAFRACRSVAVLGVALDRDAQSETVHTPTEDSEQDETIQVVA